MDANTRHIGCSASQRTVGNSVYPAKGQTAVPTSFNRCQEHPTPFGGACAAGRSVQTVGYVVAIQADGYYAIKVEAMSLSKGSARSPVDIHRAVRLRTKKTSIPSSAWTPTSR